MNIPSKTLENSYSDEQTGVVYWKELFEQEGATWGLM